MNTLSFVRKRLAYRYKNVVLYLICINGLCFLLQQIIPGFTRFMSLIPAEVVGRGRWWQLVTYMFMHGGFSHILFNMLGLFFFGVQVERTIGSSEFLLFYLLCGFGAGLVSLGSFLITGQVHTILLGASGAVYAVLLAFAAYYPDARIYIFGIFPIKAPILVIAFTVIALFSELSGRGGSTAHLTHLAGFVFAYLYMRIRLGVDPIRVFINRLR